MAKTTKTAAAAKTAADKVAELSAEEQAAKEAADKEAAELAVAEKARLAEIPTVEKAAETTPSDVVNANENPSFSKAAENNSDAEAPRKTQIGESGQWGKSVQTPDAEIAAREQRVAAKEKELEDREAKLTEKEEAATAKTEKKGTPVTFEGQKYEISANAPEQLRVNGKVYTRKELAKDEEALLHLIGGNSPLITKI